MSVMPAALQVRGLGKQKLAAVMERAKRLGMTPQRYLKHLVEEDLAVSQRAKSSSFKELLGPGELADEAEIGDTGHGSGPPGGGNCVGGAGGSAGDSR